MNKSLDKFLEKTLWVWLPFYALIALVRRAAKKSKP
jgi:hypothetical protein